MKTSVHQNQRGLSHVLVAVLIVVILAIIGVVGWRVAANHSKNKSTNNSTSTSTGSAGTSASAQSTCLAKYHDNDLCAFVAAEASQPFDKTAAKITISGTATSGGSSGDITLTQDGKGNESFTLLVNGQSVNSVVYAGVTYIEENGAWISYSSGSSTSSSATPPDSSLSTFASSLNSVTFTKLGNDACGNQTCLKYQIKDSTEPNATEYAWIDTSDHLLKQFYISDPSQGEQLTMTISYQAVTISKPSPVESLSTQ